MSISQRIVVLGPAAEARGALASIVQSYRAQELLQRWPIEYLATHGDGGMRRNGALLLKAIGRLLVLLVKERGLVVHVHSTAGRFWFDALFMLLALAARAPLVVQLHGSGFTRLDALGSRAVRAMLGWVLEQAACVLVSCEYLRGWVRGLTRRARVEHVPTPVSSPSAASNAQRANLVLFLARLDAATGIFELLEAVAGLRCAVPDVRLLCAGEGDRASVLRYAERLGIADAVKFATQVGPSGKRALYESAAAFALPSHLEALPLELLEAMAAGVPAVVSPVGAMGEVVVDGVSGLFAAPGDVATLERQLRKLLIDRKLAARLSAAARASVRLRCAPERAAARLGALYAELGIAAYAATPAQTAL